MKKHTGDAWKKGQRHRVKGCVSVFSNFSTMNVDFSHQKGETIMVVKT